MIKLLGLSTVLLSLVLLISTGSVSARSGGGFLPNPGSDVQIKAVAFTVNPSQVLAIWASPLYAGGNGGNQYGNGNGNNNGSNKNKKHYPTPEPSTILSFGAALLISGGVLYSRRLRRSRK